MRILYAGFEPFGGEATNPSYEALRLLPAAVGGAEVYRAQLPTAFEAGPRALLAAMERIQPDCVICVGQAGGRAAVTPEKVAVNCRDARIPDNAGLQPCDERVDDDGPAAYFTGLPVRRIVERCREAGIPAAVSYSAGTFVCNAVMYRLMRAVEQRFPGVKAGLIHVPYAAEQAAAREASTPGMELRRMAEALRIAGEEALAGR